MWLRRLVVVQGENRSIIRQLTNLSDRLPGDWIVISDDYALAMPMTQHYANKQTKQLLGREFKHGIFDARESFNLDSLAILTGTLIAGSVLIVILPEDLTHWRDNDSLRWSECDSAIQVGNFITHLNYVIEQQAALYPESFYRLAITREVNDNYLFNQLTATNGLISDVLKNDVLKTDLSKNNPLIIHAVTLASVQEQQSLLNQIIDLNRAIILVTAKRGRGKSALAGYFAQHHDCWVTAPNRNAVRSLMRFAPKDTPFFAPDELILQLTQSVKRPNWLIIDEAAMIPLPMIAKLIAGFNHVLLTSTTDGYEGTGQGLLLKLLEQFSATDVAILQLHTPIRWLANDPLEQFVDRLIVADLPAQTAWSMTNPLEINNLKQADLVKSAATLWAFFGLLKEAHYRTSLIDLRRLLDAPKLLLYSAQFDDANMAGVLVAIEEGGLYDDLVEQILQGYRRPKGNLVAQSLVAHGGEPRAAKLHSIRVNRIAVRQALRRQHIAASLLLTLIEQATRQGRDFVSASFAYSAEVCQFWLKCGFHIVHVGTHQEASSGSYAVMVIYPLTAAGREMCNAMQMKIARNWYWLRQFIQIDLPIAVNNDQQLNQADKTELMRFASSAYAYSASFAVLYRLINWAKKQSKELLNQLPLLYLLTEKHFADKVVIEHYKLSGKSELLKLLRQEIYHFIRMQGFINE